MATPLTLENLEAHSRQIMEHTHWEVVACRERIMMFCRTLINDHLPDAWKVNNIHPRLWDNQDWDDFSRQLQVAAQNALDSLAGGEHLGLFAQHDRESCATVMERYLMLTTSDTSQPWLARMMMQTRGVSEGDMLNPDLRGMGSWHEPRDQSKAQNVTRVYKDIKMRGRRRKD